MKTIKFHDLEFKAEKIVKNLDNIKGYTNGQEVFSFDGISDFTPYKLMNNETYNEIEFSEKERIEKLETVVNTILKGVV